MKILAKFIKIIKIKFQEYFPQIFLNHTGKTSQPFSEANLFYLKYFCVLSVLFITTNIFPQDSTIAKVGPLKITKEEFTERYELVPQLTKDTDPSLNKYNLLYSLIAEKLWALEAENENLDTALINQTAYKRIEQMYVRDALYKIEIASKSKATNEEISQGLKKYFSDISVISLIEIDSSKIFKDYAELNAGISFDSLIQINNLIADTGTIKYGELDENTENLFYNLKVGEYTAPLNTNNVWMIIKINDFKSRSYNSEDINAAKIKVKKVIEDRKQNEVYKKFMDKFFVNMNVETDGDIFWKISDLLSDQLSRRKTEQAIPDTQNINLESKDISNIESELGENMLNASFIQFKNNPVTAKDFLEQFLFDGFYSAKVDEKTISAKLNSRVKSFIESELLAREGYRRGLQNLPEVRSQIQMWKQNYLAKLFKQRLIDSVKVTDEEVYQYYLNKNKSNVQPAQVNILEILTDSLEVAEQVLDQLNNGADFKTLASVYTKRKWTKDKGGEFGFFPSTMYGEIGKTAATMNIGQIYGPLKVKEGYSIFKLIDKKESDNGLLPPYDSVKSKVKTEAYFQKLADYFINYTAKLADKYNVEINKVLFNQIKLLDLKTYAFRYMGFGGRITAVPSTINFTEWVPVWENKLKAAP